MAATPESGSDPQELISAHLPPPIALARKPTDVVQDRARARQSATRGMLSRGQPLPCESPRASSVTRCWHGPCWLPDWRIRISSHSGSAGTRMRRRPKRRQTIRNTDVTLPGRFFGLGCWHAPEEIASSGMSLASAPRSPAPTVIRGSARVRSQAQSRTPGRSRQANLDRELGRGGRSIPGPTRPPGPGIAGTICSCDSSGHDGWGKWPLLPFNRLSAPIHRGPFSSEAAT